MKDFIECIKFMIDMFPIFFYSKKKREKEVLDNYIKSLTQYYKDHPEEMGCTHAYPPIFGMKWGVRNKNIPHSEKEVLGDDQDI